MNRMYIMCGIVGSFKTTKAKSIQAGNTNSVIISRDCLRDMLFTKYVFSEDTEEIVRRMNRSLISTALLNHKDIIIDETNITRAKRMALITIARRAGYKPIIIWCKGDGNNLKNRMKDSRGYDEGRWSKVIEEMKAKFEEPTESECEVFVQDNTSEV